MRLYLVLFIVLAIFAVLLIEPTQSKYHQELGWEKIKINPNHLVYNQHRKNAINVEDDDHELTFRVFLKQSNVDALDAHVRMVSDPKSPYYTDYWSIEEVTSFIQPSQKTFNAVDAWINKHNPISTTYHANRDSVLVKMTKKNVEKMFAVRMEKYVHKTALQHGAIYRSAVDPILPGFVESHVDLITGISHFPVVQNKKRVANKAGTQLPPPFLVDDEDMLASSGSSSDAPQGLNIVGIKGYGNNLKVIFNPSCSPSCKPGKTLPITVTTQIVTQNNNYFNPTSSQYQVTPNCTVANNVYTCFAFVPSPLNIPITVSITDSTDAQSVWPYQFVSTPIVLPQVIKQLYGIPTNYIVTNQSATQCVVEFEQQYYSPTDLNIFFEQMGLPSIGNLVNVTGYNDVTNPGVEASLDIQYLMGISTGAPTVFWSIYTNSSAEIDDILTWELSINADPNPPIVNSLSYGMTEGNVDYYLGQGYLVRSDIEFAKLALRGITVIIACGDAGASDLGGPPMSASDCKVLHADWPSQSPYVVAVGSTYFTPLAEPVCYQTAGNPASIDCTHNPVGEISVSVDNGMLWTTGGGISNTSSRPWYQEAVVNGYFDELSDRGLLPPSSFYNASGRSYPDVATVGHNLWVINNGEWLSVDGTSASAPIYAGLVTILNDIRLNAGLKQVGFMNPLLYQIAAEHPEAFYDVTVGNNRCGVTGFDPTCCTYGWNALPGYDQTSGLGRPNMEVLMKLILEY
ncbi:peptidase C53 family protein [Cavenderia fasciculata]|uniref:Peptidase C53 family protein n=1 Tax=Cavenderia fasciculata TaxID=261658 RepID=F4Q791_CACFS|nr:peptidase C53 family protein [Cavenderia fasciculata]EGG16273.1 peptidase C53 family protein [Cavenderia fasciculata]|eukprot:XP_004354657.1 peptidase C53 family protein [Cavenderia fasciculata]